MARRRSTLDCSADPEPGPGASPVPSLARRRARPDPEPRLTALPTLRRVTGAHEIWPAVDPIPFQTASPGTARAWCAQLCRSRRDVSVGHEASGPTPVEVVGACPGDTTELISCVPRTCPPFARPSPILSTGRPDGWDGPPPKADPRWVVLAHVSCTRGPDRRSLSRRYGPGSGAGTACSPRSARTWSGRERRG